MARIVKIINERILLGDSAEAKVFRKATESLATKPASSGSIAFETQSDPELVEETLQEMVGAGLANTVSSGSTGPYAGNVYFLTGDGRRLAADVKRASQVSSGASINIRHVEDPDDRLK